MKPFAGRSVLSLLALFWLAPALLAADAPPVVFQTDGRKLADAKARFRAGDAAVAKIVQEITKEADKALAFKAVSVVDKPFTPPSGDKHDYMSLSPYWWPDPSKPDGKPYIRKDGEINPERAKYDLEPMEKTADAIGALGLAYYFTEDEKYAAKAAELLRHWFIRPETRMNPNTKYAQFVPGMDEMRAAGVIETNRLRKVVDADGLLQGSKAWTSADSAQLKAWFKELLHYLQTSGQGKKEEVAENNHGTWYGVQTATYALYTGDTELAKNLINQHGRDRIAKQIEPDGSQPEELARTNGYDYSRYNILAHIELAMLGERVGLDLWSYQTADGRSLRKAIDWLLPYATGEKKWEYQQIKPPKMKETATVLRRAANAYNEPKYEEAIKRLANLEGGKPSPLTELFFPSRLNGGKQASSR
jgi:hypothetical protein